MRDFNIQFKCVEGQDCIAKMEYDNGSSIITVNKEPFEALSLHDQQQVLVHEAMHAIVATYYK
jgi:predicted metallopeptidase